VCEFDNFCRQRSQRETQSDQAPGGPDPTALIVKEQLAFRLFGRNL
jgi:hypothetical protein